MMNQLGVVQNNSGTYKFQDITYRLGSECEPISKVEERRMIDELMASGRERELRDKLALHNIQIVFSIARRYCQTTRDFDDMIARGMYGLTHAANTFDLYKQVMTPDRNDPLYRTDRKNCRKIPKFDKDGNPVYVKFITYATHWVFKWIMEEFRGLCSKLDNSSVSMDANAWTKKHEKSDTIVENFLNDRISPEFQKRTDVSDGLSNEDAQRLYGKIFEYVNTTSELTAFEKIVIEGTFYGNRCAKEIAEEYATKPRYVLSSKRAALEKIRKYMVNELHIDGIEDIFS